MKSALVWALIVVLTSVGVFYIVKGAQIGTLAPHSNDLWAIWNAQHSVLRGHDPYLGSADVAPSPYPPPTFALGTLFMWPGTWQAARWYWTALNLIAIAATTTWAYHLGRPYGRRGGFLLAASYLAMGSICHTLGLEQAGVVVTAMLALLLWMEKKRGPIAQGLTLAASFFKPQVSATFALPYLMQRRWLVLVVAGTYSVITWLAVSWITRAPILECFSVWSRMSKAGVFNHASDPYQLLQWMGMTPAASMKWTGLFFASATLAASWMWAHRSMLVQFAIAAVGGRLCAYHGNYDNVMLVFLLMALGVEMLRAPNSRATLAFALAGISLWPPARAIDFLPYAIFQKVAWLVGLSILLSIAPVEEKAPAPDARDEDAGADLHPGRVAAAR